MEVFDDTYFYMFLNDLFFLDDIICSLLTAMDRDALKKQIENMKYQASMERWPLSKSIAA